MHGAGIEGAGIPNKKKIQTNKPNNAICSESQLEKQGDSKTAQLL